MSSLIGSIIAFIVAGLAVLGLVPHQQAQPLPQPPQQVVQPASNAPPSNPVPAQSSAVSVPGMSKYTDTDFGFSFWYPSGWTIMPTADPHINGQIGVSGGRGSRTHTLQLANGTSSIYIQEVISQDGIYDVCGKCNSQIYFDTNKQQWMDFTGPNHGPGGTGEAHTDPADLSVKTMGDLPIFWGIIVPLSTQKFILVGTNNANWDRFGGLLPFVKTIVATDPSVATPVSAAEQIKTIQAEKAAYAGQ